MYAPKFRSWMTSWDRFEEARDHKLDEWAKGVQEEIKAMAANAIESIEASLPKPPKPSLAYVDLIQLLGNSGSIQQPYNDSWNALGMVQQMGASGLAPLGNFIGNGVWR